MLTVRPDLTADTCDVAVQTAAEQTTEVVPATENQVEDSPSSNIAIHKPQAALLYVARDQEVVSSDQQRSCQLSHRVDLQASQ